MCMGGNEYSIYSPELRDRLYFSDGDKFIKSNQILPAGKFESSSVVLNYDYDNDGDTIYLLGRD